MLFDDKLHSHQPQLYVPDEGSKADLEVLKGVHKIDLKPFCPVPQDQGFIASCTGWACGYGALTILNAIKNGWKGNTELINQNTFSALFIYNQIKKGSCDFGAYISDAAAFIRDKGDIPSKEFDKLKNNCDRQATAEELKQAQVFKVKDFLSVFGPDDPGSVKVQRMKLCLSQQKPVVVGVTLIKNFQTIPKGFEYWYPSIGDTTHNGGHSMVVIGFDDGREAFEVMNSWGTEWGNHGFVWIKYRDIEQYFHYGYVFIPADDRFQFIDLVASIELRKPVYNHRDELSFAEENVLLSNAYYVLQRGNISPQDFLQPLVKEVHKDIYFYFFSMDARNNINVHWPRDQRLDTQFDGKHESGFLALRDINLAIPGKYTALRPGHAGAEYWCFLFSPKPITRLNEYLAALKTNPIADFNRRLKKVIGPALMTADRIKYSPTRLQAESDMNENDILPIVLKLVVKDD